MTNYQPSLSVVIPTKNGGADFTALLHVLRNQVHYADAEIVVVDSGSTDGTVESAHTYGAKVIPIDPESFNHGATRNQGIAASRGELIAFFTQDALPQGNEYLLTLVKSIETPQTAGAYARQIPRPEASPLVKRDLESWISSVKEKRVTRIASPTAFFHLSPLEQYLTCVFDDVASLIRREVWERIPLPPVPFGEDIEWAFRVLVNGYTIVYEPEAVVQHSHERSPEYLYKRTYVDHYRLYEMFGLRTIPSRRHIFYSILKTSMKDWKFLLRIPIPKTARLRMMMLAPRFAWASAWGQYHGAKAAATGVPLKLSRDV